MHHNSLPLNIQKNEGLLCFEMRACLNRKCSELLKKIQENLLIPILLTIISMPITPKKLTFYGVYTKNYPKY